jgi:hypothetical protein
MTAVAKAKPARSLRVLGNPIPGLVRVLVTAGRESAEYVFARRTATEIGVRKAGRRAGTRWTWRPAGATAGPASSAGASAGTSRPGGSCNNSGICETRRTHNPLREIEP